ncbi:unnamed protein product, partial [Brenthis ino]
MYKPSKIWISTIILLGFSLDNTLSAWLRCYKTSLNNYTETSLDNPTPLLHDPCFDQNLRTVIYAFGYRGKCDGPATTAVLQAYLNMKKRNVLLLDWQYEAQSGTLGIPLGYALYAVPNAKKIGHKLGEALMILTRNGLNMTEVHLIGHSLGAHVMAYAGRWTRQRGQVISRITGLDPARALFEGTLSIRSGLDRTCAKFVDIIHTNPGYYGSTKSTGTVDIWPNFSPSDGMQPGCPKGNFDRFTPEDLCSHDRAWRYLVESISSATAFPAAGAESYSTWLDMNTLPNITMYMGELTNTKARGNYYLTTNGQAPFSKGPIGMMPNNQLRKRRNPSTLALTAIFRFLR